jgi:hypothetical protein
MKALTVIFMTLLLLVLPACTQVVRKPSAPLHTTGQTAPPDVCKQLRAKGGAC